MDMSKVYQWMEGFRSPFDQRERQGDDFLGMFRICLECFDSFVYGRMLCCVVS